MMLNERRIGTLQQPKLGQAQDKREIVNIHTAVASFCAGSLYDMSITCFPILALCFLYAVACCIKPHDGFEGFWMQPSVTGHTSAPNPSSHVNVYVLHLILRPEHCYRVAKAFRKISQPCL